MRTNTHAFRLTGIVLVVCLLHLMILPTLTAAQTQDCPYDKTNPSLENARLSFKSLDYRCAESEIMDFLKLKNITTEQRADAHVLLAAVYYAKSKDDDQKRNLVIEQFKQAFRAFRDWRGELDISSTDFIEMMNEAQKLVDQETEERPAIAEPITDEALKAGLTAGEKKPWYKKWWAIGLGVGVVAGTVIILSGGGGDDGGDEPVVDTLPGFPGTPGD